MRDWGWLGAAIAAAIAAFASVFQFLRSSADTSRKTELDELREFRKELRDEIADLRTHVNTLEKELHEAQGQILKQREYFVGVLYKLEGLLELKDISKLGGEMRRLVEGIREFLDVMPIGSLEVRQLKKMEAKTDDY